MSFWFRRKRCSERLGLEEERGYAARPRALVWEPPSHGGGRMWGQGFGVLVCLAEVCADRRRGGRGEERRNRLRAEDFTQADEVRNLLRELKEAHEDKPFSDVLDDEGNQYVDLVMEGGGVLGVALVGYTYVLEEMGIRFLRVGGTSAGSINAVLVAGLGTPAQRKSEKIIEELANVEFWDFVDGDRDVRDFVATLVHDSNLFKLGWKGVQVIDNLVWSLGLNPGDKFLEWLSSLLKREGVGTSRELRDRIATI